MNLTQNDDLDCACDSAHATAPTVDPSLVSVVVWPEISPTVWPPAECPTAAIRPASSRPANPGTVRSISPRWSTT